MKSCLILCLLSIFCLPLQGQETEVVPDTLVVGYAAAPPFIISDENKVSGINIWLWEYIAKDLNLEYKLVPMRFTAMLDSLEKGSIDISINPLTITSERNKIIHFTDPFYAANSAIAIVESSTIQKFVQFVKSFLNLNFLKGLLILLFIIFLFGSIAWYFERKSADADFRNNYRGIFDGAWWAAVTLTTVGYGDKTTKTAMGKVTALILMFGGLLFISGLTASIASTLTVTQLNSNPDDLNAIKKLPVGTVVGSSADKFLKEHFFKNIHTFENAELGLRSIQNGKVKAFVFDAPILKYTLQEDTSLNNLELLPIQFDVQFYAFGLAKHRQNLEQKISQRILEITETQNWEMVLNEYGLNEF